MARSVISHNQIDFPFFKKMVFYRAYLLVLIDALSMKVGGKNEARGLGEPALE